MTRCWVCQNEAEYISPGDLCGAHWRAWFDYKLKAEDLQHLPKEQQERLLRDE